MEFKAFVVKGDANHSDLHMQMRKSLANGATQTTLVQSTVGPVGRLGWNERIIYVGKNGALNDAHQLLGKIFSL